MSEWNELAVWLYGGVKDDRGYWYSHPLHFVDGLTEEELFWVPDETALCMLWHVGHIAHRERLHVGHFLQGIQKGLFPAGYEVFGTEWVPVDDVRRAVDSVDAVFGWVQEVREESRAFIDTLDDDDWHRVPLTSELEMTTAQWIYATVGHGAIHLGKIQMLRAMLEGEHDSPR